LFVCFYFWHDEILQIRARGLRHEPLEQCIRPRTPRAVQPSTSTSGQAFSLIRLIKTRLFGSSVEFWRVGGCSCLPSERLPPTHSRRLSCVSLRGHSTSTELLCRRLGRVTRAALSHRVGHHCGILCWFHFLTRFTRVFGSKKAELEPSLPSPQRWCRKVLVLLVGQAFARCVCIPRVQRSAEHISWQRERERQACPS
jgi:hypothetical protein